MSKYHKSVVPARPRTDALPGSPRTGLRPWGGLPLVAIVGRPNVGKSTLFNRLTGSRRSIVGDEPGITRDRIYGEYEWAGRNFRLVDTGGIVPDDPELIPTEIYNQAKVALEEADALVLVVDARTELASPDYDLVRLLIRGGKPLFLAVNKVEGEAISLAAENFRQLGIRNVFPISSEHGLGIGDLLEAISEAIPAPPEAVLTEEEVLAAQEAGDAVAEEAEISEGGPVPPEPGDEELRPLHRTHGEFEQHETSVAIIGRPNVGKSTLLNALTGTSRAIVSPIPGTTRDSVDVPFEVETDGVRSQYVLIDTAGLRKARRVDDSVEFYSAQRTVESIARCDIAVLVIDAETGIMEQDKKIADKIVEERRACIVVVNKWDLFEEEVLDARKAEIVKRTNKVRREGQPKMLTTLTEFGSWVQQKLFFLDYAPVIFTSAKSGFHLDRLLEACRR